MAQLSRLNLKWANNQCTLVYLLFRPAVEWEKQNNNTKETWGSGSLGIDRKCDCFRVGWGSVSSSFMVDSHREYSVLLRKPLDVELPCWTTKRYTDVLSQYQKTIPQIKTWSILKKTLELLRFWGWMSEARLSVWDRRPLTDRLLFSWWSNCPQVMCILWSLGYSPSGSIRGLLGYMWNLFLLPVMDL